MSENEKTTVLVTGGAGFIGSHIVDLLIKNNYGVVIVDDLSSGREENINQKAKFYKLNITDQKGLAEVFKKEKPDYVCHEAAQISVSFSVRDPLFDAQTNILGSLNLLKCCLLNHQVKGIVFASSGGTIYGEPEHFPITEDYPFSPQSPYGISKVTVEHYLDFYQKNYHLPYVALRYGNVYGPRQDPYGEAGVIAIFIEKMLKGEIPTINGDGEYIRDYIYVEDVAQANLLALKNMVKLSKVVREMEKAREKEKEEAETETEAKPEIKFNGLNLGAGEGVSVNEIFSLLKEIIKFPHPAHYGPPRAGDLRKNILDCRLIKEVLGWQSQFDFSAGLEKTVNWFKENIH